MNMSISFAGMSIETWLVVLLLIGQILAWRQLRQLQRRQTGNGEALQHALDDLDAFEKAAIQAGEQLVRLEQKVRGLLDRQDQMELRTSGSRPYSHAIQLVQRGASVDELIAMCGLTRGEAELICMLHGTRAAHAKSGQDSISH
jgi:biopolymer transport protein ExbB/TolQ